MVLNGWPCVSDVMVCAWNAGVVGQISDGGQDNPEKEVGRNETGPKANYSRRTWSKYRFKYGYPDRRAMMVVQVYRYLGPFCVSMDKEERQFRLVSKAHVMSTSYT